MSPKKVLHVHAASWSKADLLTKEKIALVALASMPQLCRGDKIITKISPRSIEQIFYPYGEFAKMILKLYKELQTKEGSLNMAARYKEEPIKKTPRDYTTYPWSSIMGSSEYETTALNVMQILARTGNKWRELSFKEYAEERKKDGNFSSIEEGYFKEVVGYCCSADTAKLFSSSWKNV